MNLTTGTWSRALRAAFLIVTSLAILPQPNPLGSISMSTNLTLPTTSVPSLIPTPPLAASPASTAAPDAASSNSGVSAPAPSQAAPPMASAEPPPRPVPRHETAIPFTAVFVDSPFDIAIFGALVSLPVLLGIWLLLFGRTFGEARRAREAETRLFLAADLGLRPRDLTSMSTKSLFALREKAAFDELTGVLRRAAGISAAEREIARARRNNAPLTVAFIDVDGLKETNDRDGHAAGDAMLRGLAGALKDGLRGEDVLFRYGGDEFVCVLWDTTIRDARAKLGEVQDAANKLDIRFCAGLAQLQRSDDVVSLFARADQDLYQFKTGRGQIVPLPSGKKSERTITA